MKKKSKIGSKNMGCIMENCFLEQEDHTSVMGTHPIQIMYLIVIAENYQWNMS